MKIHICIEVDIGLLIVLVLKMIGTTLHSHSSSLAIICAPIYFDKLSKTN
jgi:hypothetical protein